MSRASLKALSAFGASPNLRKRPMSHLVVCWLSSLNGLELSRPAARATGHGHPRHDILDAVPLQVVPTDLVEAEVQIVDSVIHLLEPDVLLIERLARKHLLALHPDRPTPADPPNQVVPRVLIVLDPSWDGPKRRLVHLRRPLHPQPLVPSLRVEVPPKGLP